MSVEEKAQKWDELCDKARNLLADDAGSEEFTLIGEYVAHKIGYL